MRKEENIGITNYETSLLKIQEEKMENKNYQSINYNIKLKLHFINYIVIITKE